MGMRMDERCMCEEESPYFLYEDNWRTKDISSMDDGHLINTVMMLEKRAMEYKEQFEIYLLGTRRSHPVLEPKFDLMEIARMDEKTWLESTPIYKKLIEELNKRDLGEYLTIVKERKAKEAEKYGGKKNISYVGYDF